MEEAARIFAEAARESGLEPSRLGPRPLYYTNEFDSDEPLARAA
jgi:hypothetical protein